MSLTIPDWESFSLPDDPNSREEFIAWLQDVCESLKPFVEQPLGGSGIAYLPEAELNGPGSTTPIQSAYSPSPGYLAREKFLNLFEQFALDEYLNFETDRDRNKVEIVRDLRKEMQRALKALDKQPGAANDATLGFLGGKDLDDALGIHSSRSGAFFRQLERKRKKLGDNNWQEVCEPRPNSPRFLYRADSPEIVKMAAAYQQPKSD